MLISFGLNTMAQVAVNTDGSDPDVSSVLHVKGNSTKKHIVIEPGATGGVGVGITIPNTFLHINSGSSQDPFRVQINGFSKLFTLNNGGTGIGNFTETLPPNGLYVYGSVGIGINSPPTSAKLEISSTSQGFLPPRMSNEQMNAIASPATGLMVYNTGLNSPMFYDGSVWKKMYNSNGESSGPISYGGQTYETVIIGSQIWMAENLNIGTMIGAWSLQTNNGIIEKYCYNSDESYCDTYGGLYQWNEMMQYVTTEGAQGICPDGWHLPTDDEWKTLEMELGMSQSEADGYGFRGTDEGERMKSTSGWANDGNGTNCSSFNGLPGGELEFPETFLIFDIGCWSTTSKFTSSRVWTRRLEYSSDQVKRYDETEDDGFSIRCLKN